jgi:hypothetical protein
MDDDEETVCYDMAVLVLKNPVRFPVLSLDQLNPIPDITVEDEFPFHMDFGGSPQGELRPEERPVAIGYGTSGFMEERQSFKYLPVEEMRISFGLDVKRAVIFPALDRNREGVFENMKPCQCTGPKSLELELKCLSSKASFCRSTYKLVKFYHNLIRIAPRREYYLKAKEYIEQFRRHQEDLSKMKEDYSRHKDRRVLYGGPLSGPGFSGSLVLRKGEEGRYDVFGMYSGPLFTNEIKIFIGNAAQHYSTHYAPLERGFLRQMERGAGDIVWNLWRIEQGIERCWRRMVQWLGF